ncbi:N-acetylmuramoyl-L-alanine amidase [Allorhizocola rhizosphaerae]|uniref:golvesin C-terminal-like domain-containing protein n=1 Tax=Allorhizocola rhizosphaerae TaxID=1872709 RepID=UPI000E3ED825|nr:N-acetylmuramoyl-L-alanine amidase [Allorhizocola rhizosphaerae]
MHLSRRNVFRGAVVLGAGTVLPPLAQASPALAVPAPTIASCATWGARNPSSPLQQLSNDPNKIIIHHTATPNSTDYSLAHAYALSRSIQNWHMDNNGWSDTGQNFTVSRGGHITEGRHTSLSHLSSGNGFVTSAHCPGQNTTGVGIENEGTYTSVLPTTALWDKLVDLCAYICQQWGISPSAIYGHRDFVATACPGNAFYAKLPDLKAAVAAKLNAPPAWSTVIDNTSAGFRASENWGVSTYSTQRYGADYRYATPVAASDAAYFSATLPQTGNYRLDVWYPANSGYHASAPHIVFASTGNQTVTVNQTTNGGAWRSIGTFPFAAGARDLVAVSRWTSGTAYVIADAVRVTRV